MSASIAKNPVRSLCTGHLALGLKYRQWHLKGIIGVNYTSFVSVQRSNVKYASQPLLLLANAVICLSENPLA